MTQLFVASLQHHQAGRLAEAERGYRQVLAGKPRHADALHLLGVIEHLNGRSELGAGLIRQAIGIDGRRSAYYANLGTALWKLGQLDAATAAYRHAIELQPDYANAHFNLGTVLEKLGCPDAAVASLRDAIRHDPNHAGAHNNLGTVLSGQGRCEEAIECFVQALRLKPHYPEALTSLGSLLAREGRGEEALQCHHAALALQPGYPEAHFNLGTTLLEQSQPDAAAASFRAALALRPDCADAHDNLASALKQSGQLDEAVASYRRAVALQPDHAGAHTNLALALLAQGKFEEAWPEHEWRWQTPQLRAACRGFPQPQWTGEPGTGRKLLLHAEQGFGDTLQFCRYASMAVERGWQVLLEVPPPLVRLLRSLPGVTQVLARGEALPAFDQHCPMMSLPLALATTFASIPGVTPYLHADPIQVAAWRTRLAASVPAGRRVGVVWAGNPRRHSAALAAVDQRRSLPPELLAPLFQLPGLQFFSLQKDGPAAPTPFPLLDHMTEMADFADTAALIANLDLVISVDTAVVHLAGALGKPVWMLDRFDPCWRWLTGRRDSPWYPTLRLYRQPKPGDWSTVVAEIVDGLQRGAGDAAGYIRPLC